MKITALRSINRLLATRLTGAVIVLAGALLLAEIAAAQQTVWVADGVGNWNVSGNWSNGVPDAGEFAAINNGGTARLFDSNGFLTDVSLAQNSGNIGTLEVPGGHLTQTGVLLVGQSGQGILNVTNNGDISNARSIIGDNPGSSGVATVNGAGSQLVVTNQTSPQALIVGRAGAGTLNITGGGVVTSISGALGVNNGSTGTVLIDGPGSRWFTHTIDMGFLGAAGTSTLTVQNGGALPDGASLGTKGTVRGDGTVGSLYNFGGVVAPGSPIGSLKVNAGYEQIFSAKLQIELASNTSFDKLAVGGLLRLSSDSIFGGGALEVSLVGGYVPSGTRSFDVLDWGTQFGTFDTITLPTLGGTLMWNTSQLYTTGVISVTGPAATLTADFDANGVVNGADLAQWGDDFGRTGGATKAQGNADGDGDVDGGDFLAWQRQFGSAAASASAASVPEPAGSAYLIIGALCWLSWRRFRPTRQSTFLGSVEFLKPRPSVGGRAAWPNRLAM